MTEPFPYSEAEFYRRRDDRTDTVLEEVDGDQYYQNATLFVTADPDLAATYAGQVCLLTTANMLSRFARDVDLYVPDVAVDPALQLEQARLNDRLLEEMTGANPFGAFDCGKHRSPPEYDGAIVLGNTDIDIDPVIRIDASGWLARVTRDEYVPIFSDHHEENPIGPGVGACLGVAELFKTLSDQPSRLHTTGYTFDAFNLDVLPATDWVSRPPVPKQIQLGNLHLVGAGSVGSSLLYFLRMLPIQGQVDVVDCDIVELENLNRSPIFTAHDAVNERAKVAVGQDYLDGHISVSGHNMRYAEFVDTEQNGQPDVVIPVANEYGVRASIQFNRPPVMVHTTTGGSRVYVRRNIPIVDPCLLCHFPPDETGFAPNCAQAPISQSSSSQAEDDTPDAALPFVSVTAGVLLAGELVKLTRDEYPITRDFVELDMFSTFAESPITYDWPHKSDCPFCTTQNESVHRALIDETRFAHLSAVTKVDKE